MASSSSVAVSAPRRKIEKTYWTDDESRILSEYVAENGEKEWKQAAIKTGLRDAGKSADSCWRRWFNQLKPGLDNSPFTPKENAIIILLHNKYDGQKKKWAKIANHLTGRTGNRVKNHWNTKLSKNVQVGVGVGQQLIHEDTNAQYVRLLFEDTNTPDFNQDVDIGDQQLLFECTESPGFDQFSLSDQIYNNEFSEFNLDIDIGDQQLLFECTETPGFDQFSLSDQIYNNEFS